MNKFKRRPDVVTAMQWYPETNYPGVRVIQCQGSSCFGILNGQMVTPGDWIMKERGVERVVREDHFKAEFEPHE